MIAAANKAPVARKPILAGMRWSSSGSAGPTSRIRKAIAEAV